MESKDCELKDACIEFLCDFPDRVPHRCSQCIPMVRHTLTKLVELYKNEHETLVSREEDQWNNGCYDV